MRHSLCVRICFEQNNIRFHRISFARCLSESFEDHEEVVSVFVAARVDFNLLLFTFITSLFICPTSVRRQGIITFHNFLVFKFILINLNDQKQFHSRASAEACAGVKNIRINLSSKNFTVLSSLVSGKLRNL